MSGEISGLDEVKVKVRELRRQYEMISGRDRMMLNGLIVFLVVVAGFFILLKPSLDSVSDAQLKLKGKQELLQWIQSNESLAKSLRKGGGKSQGRKPGQSLLALINQTSSQFRVPLKRYEPEGQDKLRVWVEDIPFNGFMRWLTSLQSKHNVNVINISIDSQKQPGIINAKVVLKG
ncbi:MAG: hypothetical protein COA99_02040 [Moraxellaceae bacterium]|nr:MAG: hypothetical protein COA99_02040 [Moraxellaceae bacterium]